MLAASTGKNQKERGGDGKVVNCNDDNDDGGRNREWDASLFAARHNGSHSPLAIAARQKSLVEVLTRFVCHCHQLMFSSSGID